MRWHRPIRLWPMAQCCWLFQGYSSSPRAERFHSRRLYQRTNRMRALPEQHRNLSRYRGYRVGSNYEPLSPQAAPRSRSTCARVKKDDKGASYQVIWTDLIIVGAERTCAYRRLCGQLVTYRGLDFAGPLNRRAGHHALIVSIEIGKIAGRRMVRIEEAPVQAEQVNIRDRIIAER